MGRKFRLETVIFEIRQVISIWDYITIRDWWVKYFPDLKNKFWPISLSYVFHCRSLCIHVRKTYKNNDHFNFHKWRNIFKISVKIISTFWGKAFMSTGRKWSQPLRLSYSKSAWIKSDYFTTGRIKLSKIIKFHLKYTVTNGS